MTKERQSLPFRHPETKSLDGGNRETIRLVRSDNRDGMGEPQVRGEALIPPKRENQSLPFRHFGMMS